MSKTNISAKQIDDMAFETELNGHKLIMDASDDVGGKDLGPRPKPLLLSALIGCTGMDVASILRKMKVQYDDLEISVEAESSDEHPRVYTSIHLVYTFVGDDLPLDKLQKAVDLSQERYCGVSAMLKEAAELTYEIVMK